LGGRSGRHVHRSGGFPGRHPPFLVELSKRRLWALLIFATRGEGVLRVLDPQKRRRTTIPPQEDGLGWQWTTRPRNRSGKFRRYSREAPLGCHHRLEGGEPHPPGPNSSVSYRGKKSHLSDPRKGGRSSSTGGKYPGGQHHRAPAGP